MQAEQTVKDDTPTTERRPWTARLRGQDQTPQPLILPSLASCDLMRVAESVRALELGGADVLHVDIMDGTYVRNLSVGMRFVECLRSATRCALDVHLMVSDANYYAHWLTEVGVESLSFHLEAVRSAKSLVEALQKRKVSVGLALSPETCLAALQECVSQVEFVLLSNLSPSGMAVPLRALLDRARMTRSLIRPDQRLVIDGDLDRARILQFRRAGADTFVVGRHLFLAPDIRRRMEECQRLLSVKSHPD